MLQTVVYAQTKFGQFKDVVERLRKDNEGVAMIEYALLAGLVAVAAVTAIILLRAQLNTKFTDITGALAQK